MNNKRWLQIVGMSLFILNNGCNSNTPTQQPAKTTQSVTVPPQNTVIKPTPIIQASAPAPLPAAQYILPITQNNVSVPTSTPAPQTPSLAPVLIDCKIAQDIDAAWDRIVDDVQPCFFDYVSGKLNPTLDSCTESNKSLLLVPALNVNKPVLFGDDYSKSQKVSVLVDGQECFSHTRKSSQELQPKNHFILSKNSEVLFETYSDSINFYVKLGTKIYYKPNDSASQNLFNRTCGYINISGRWGSNHVFYGPQSVFKSFSFHFSKSNGNSISSTCLR